MKFLLAALLVVSALPAAAANHSVSIKGMKFSPASLTVAAGDTITFSNGDAMPHTASGPAFDTGNIAPGSSKKVTVPAAGTHAYKCKLHPSMKGSVTAR
ncbi:MAG: cupredoxin family copper-binding protein [Notoacmeibacter sp.]|nr:cupredoxin family copper-binding protein [Notoacmeibacter sp.]MCC0032076.1 cupredoxin family copper-binding protein [Brucellaceae bacterium]